MRSRTAGSWRSRRAILASSPTTARWCCSRTRATRSGRRWLPSSISRRLRSAETASSWEVVRRDAASWPFDRDARITFTTADASHEDCECGTQSGFPSRDGGKTLAGVVQNAPRPRAGGRRPGAARKRGDRPVARGAPRGSPRGGAGEANGRVLRAAARGCSTTRGLLEGARVTVTCLRVL